MRRPPSRSPSRRSGGRFRRTVGLLALAGAAVLPALPPTAAAAPPWPFARERSAVERIADRIDDLEEDLEKYGSVVAKQPDVWGEARLTKYRVEYEQQMARRAGGFRDTLNASLSRSDQLYLSAALALNDAPAAEATELPSGASLGVVNLITAPPGAETEAGTAAAVARTPGVLQSVGGGEFAGLAAGTQKNVDETPGLRIEPVLGLEQQSRYLNRLHQLRRTNEGDDTSDSPGYALNLVRVPVSVLPGDRTRTGWGAEITVTVDPYLGPELLPRTFRDLVVNDVTDRLGLSLTRFVNEDTVGTATALNLFARYIENRDALIGFGRQIAAVEGGRPPGLVLTLPAKSLAALRAAPESDACGGCGVKPGAGATGAGATGGGATDPAVINDDAAGDDAAGGGTEETRLPAFDLDSDSSTSAADGFGSALPLAPPAFVPRAPRSVREMEAFLYGAPITPPAAPGAREEALSEEYLRALERYSAPGLEEPGPPPGDSSGALDGGPADVLPVLHAVPVVPVPAGAGVNFRANVGRLGTPDLLVLFGAVKVRSAVPAAEAPLSPADARLLFERAARLLQGGLEAGEKTGAAELVESAVPLGRDRRARFALPGNQVLPVYGFAPVAQILRNVVARAGDERRGAKFVHYDDVAGLLREELFAAYELFDARPDLLETFVTPELHRAIRELRHPDSLLENALAFDPELGEYLDRFEGVRQPDPGSAYVAAQRAAFFSRFPEDQQRNPIVALAWAIVVDSALLNERLAEDIREQASLKGCGCGVPPEGLPFFLPHPPPEALAAFEEYVRCRWPIHTFALDPVTDDQNIADAFSQRRETQLALSVALARGNILPQTFSRLARRTELDAATIALNRPIVGFAHGEDTFGWRMRPRFQTPEIEGTIPAAFGALIGGPSRDSLLARRQIEPGQRDLTAVVLMPSFVPYATFHFRSNWFRLKSPDVKAFDLETSAEMGRELLCLRRAAGCLPGAHCYRPEDVGGLTVALDQLEKRLPTQTTQVQIPHENTLGGFELFSAGVTALAPELKGFYGAPGFVHGGDKATVIYVVGDSFSVHETRVIAGNRDVTDYAVTAAQPLGFTDTGAALMERQDITKTRLLSRQVMQVVIPAHAQPEAGGDWLDLHVATPYGVSNHLRVPVHPSGPTAAEAAALKAAAEAAKLAAAGVHGGPGSGFAFAQTELTADFVVLRAADGVAPAYCLKIDPNAAGGRVARIALNVPGGGLPFDTPEVEFAAFVVPVVNGLEMPRFKTPREPVVLETSTISLNRMEEELRAVITAEPEKLADADALRVYGYVRFKNDGRPAFKLEEPLTLTLRQPGDAGYCLCPRCPAELPPAAAAGNARLEGVPPAEPVLAAPEPVPAGWEAVPVRQR